MTNIDRWKLYMRDIESPDIYIEWGFYHLISSALQRRVWFYSDPKTKLPSSHSMFANEFIILVGKPATGKGRVITQESSIIKSNQMIFPGPNGEQLPVIPYSPDKLTLEALTQHIASGVKYVKHRISPTETFNYAYCPCSFLIEELEVLFAQNTNDMVSVLVHCYDSHDLHYKTKHQGQDNIKNVCVTMVAGTTPDSIRDLMHNKVIKKGFTSRAVMIYADAPRFYRQFPGIDDEQRQAYGELFDYIKSLTSVFGEVTLSSDAAAYHKRLYESGITHKERVNKDPRLDDYYGRKNSHWLKLATMLHFSESHGNYEIQKETMELAYERLKWAELRMDAAFQTSGRNVLHETSMQIMRFIEERHKAGYGLLRWKFNNDCKKEDLDECLDFLASTGYIRNNGGEYHLVKPMEGNEASNTHTGNSDQQATDNTVNLSV